MTLAEDQMQSVCDQYDSRFHNLDEIGHPSIVVDTRFIDLLGRSVREIRKITRPDVDALFGALSWEE